MIVESREEYIRNLPDKLSLYQQPEFLSAVNENWTAVVSKNERGVEWMVPCLKIKKYGLVKYGPTELGHNNAIVLADKDSQIQNSPTQMKGTFKLMINDWNGQGPSFLMQDFQRNERNRQYFDLKNYPVELDGFRKSLRNNIRRASNCQLHLSSDINRFYKLYSMTFARRQIEQWPLKRIERIFVELKKSFNSYLFILVDDKGRDLAANWLVGFGDTVYGLLSAKNYEINQRGSHEYMKWEMIKQLRQDYDFYDLGGSNIPGVKDFNMKLGAENVIYPSYIYSKPKFLWSILDRFSV